MPKTMTGQEAIDYIHSYNWLGSRPGLSRTADLLSRMGHPERELRFVHIVGTNGKGSTASMLEHILHEAGYVTGLYTSPYLWRFHERIRVDGAEITGDELGEVTDYVRRFAEEMQDHPTEFELVTCIALEYYRRRGCSIVVLEAGLGGRLDSTNVIPAPEVAVITNIGLDHTELLGDTVEKIAAEKGAVIKPGCEAVLYGQTEPVEAVIADICRTQGVPLAVADFAKLRVREDSRGGQCFDYGDLSGLSIRLLGEHQRKNAAVALETVFALRRRGWEIPEDALRRGLALAQWPGREAFPLVVVADDAEFCAQALDNFLWVAFTRSDPATDVYGANAATQARHWKCEAPLVIDARLKPFHAPPLEEDAAVIRKVEALAAPGGPLHNYL